MFASFDIFRGAELASRRCGSLQAHKLYSHLNIVISEAWTDTKDFNSDWLRSCCDSGHICRGSEPVSSLHKLPCTPSTVFHWRPTLSGIEADVCLSKAHQWLSTVGGKQFWWEKGHWLSWKTFQTRNLVVEGVQQSACAKGHQVRFRKAHDLKWARDVLWGVRLSSSVNTAWSFWKGKIIRKPRSRVAWSLMLHCSFLLQLGGEVAQG